MALNKVDKIILFIVTVIATTIIGVSLAFADITPEELQVRIDRTVRILIRVDGTQDAVAGSGLILDSGKLLTAGHLFSQGTYGKIRFPGGAIYRTVRTPAERHIPGETDAALATGAKVSGRISVRCTYPRAGERITVVGYPAQIGPLVMYGSVASTRALEPDNEYAVAGLETAQGISGAPVFDSDGQVLGVLVGLMQFEVGGLGSLVPTASIPELCDEH